MNRNVIPPELDASVMDALLMLGLISWIKDGKSELGEEYLSRCSDYEYVIENEETKKCRVEANYWLAQISNVNGNSEDGMQRLQQILSAHPTHCVLLEEDSGS